MSDNTLSQEMEYYIDSNPQKYPPRNEWVDWLDYYENRTVSTAVYPSGTSAKNKGSRIDTHVLAIRIEGEKFSMQSEQGHKNYAWKEAFRKIIEFYKDDEQFQNFIKNYTKVKETTEDLGRCVFRAVTECNKKNIFFKYEIIEIREDKQEMTSIQELYNTIMIEKVKLKVVALRW